MKFWCDLSWSEKCRIKEGNINILDYSSGYSFDVKTKAAEGIEKNREKNLKKSQKKA